jgi:membrane protein implicated in regulation of membrane protease activity
LALVAAVLLAVFVLDDPWRLVAVVAGGAIEVGEAWFWWRWTHRRRPAVGPEALIGKEGEMVDDRWVKIDGELWRAEGASKDDHVEVVAKRGLTLIVRPTIRDGAEPQAQRPVS